MPRPEHVEAMIRVVEERLGVQGLPQLDERETDIVESIAQFVDAALAGTFEAVLAPLAKALEVKVGTPQGFLEPCQRSTLVSRTCEVGTRGCVVAHGRRPPPPDAATRPEQKTIGGPAALLRLVDPDGGHE